MRSFSEYDPIVIAVYFLTVIGIAMFCSYPALTAAVLAGGVAYYIVCSGSGHGKSHFYFFLLFLILALANPLVSHNGETVLFVMNDNPITLEAVLYGVNSAAMVIGVLYWLRSFTHIMTSEKLLRITGALSPKLSLVISMALRYVPLFREQSEKVSDAQKAMGMFREDNIIDDIRGKLRIFSVLITWALENGIVTADSMAARGFGSGRRTQFSNFRFRRADRIFLAADLVLFGICAASVGAGRLGFTFYPGIKASSPGPFGIAGIAAYCILVFLPVITEAEVRLKWKYLESKI